MAGVTEKLSSWGCFLVTDSTVSSHMRRAVPPLGQPGITTGHRTRPPPKKKQLKAKKVRIGIVKQQHNSELETLRKWKAGGRENLCVEWVRGVARDHGGNQREVEAGLPGTREGTEGEGCFCF